MKSLTSIRERLAKLAGAVPISPSEPCKTSEEMIRECASLIEELEAQGVAVNRDAPEPSQAELAEIMRDVRATLAELEGTAQP